MKISYECGPCFLRQAKEALDLSTDDEALKMEIMGDIFKFLSRNFESGTNSNSTGSAMHKMIIERTGCRDPYYNEKIQGNEIALRYLPEVEKILRDDDSLENYVKISIIGNILDFGAFTLDDDIESVIRQSLKKDLVIKAGLLLDGIVLSLAHYAEGDKGVLSHERIAFRIVLEGHFDILGQVASRFDIFAITADETPHSLVAADDFQSMSENFGRQYFHSGVLQVGAHIVGADAGCMNLFKEVD